MDIDDRDQVEALLLARKELSVHGQSDWPLSVKREGKYDGPRVIKSTWWVAMAQSRLQIFRSICGGVEKASEFEGFGQISSTLLLSLSRLDPTSSTLCRVHVIQLLCHAFICAV